MENYMLLVVGVEEKFFCRHAIAVKMKLTEYPVAGTTLLLSQKNKLIDI